jgi:hypothetical protein
MVVGARRTALCQELQHCWVVYAQQFPVCFKNGPAPKGNPAGLSQLWDALESTWASVPVENLTPCRVHALTNLGFSEGKRGGCNSILGRGPSCFVHSVYTVCTVIAGLLSAPEYKPHPLNYKKIYVFCT